jgi:hypothetical protein
MKCICTHTNMPIYMYIYTYMCINDPVLFIYMFIFYS